MVAIDLQNLSNTSPTYGFQSALFSFLGVDPDAQYSNTSGPRLYWEGCKHDTTYNATRNCTAACLDASLLFQSPFTVQNCMVLSQLGPSIQLTDSAQEVVKEYSVDPSDTGLFANINHTLQQCFTQYCSMSSENCGPRSSFYTGVWDNPWYSPLITINGSICSQYTGGLCFSNVCSNIEAPLNADIGGIGVLLLEILLLKEMYINILNRYAYPILCRRELRL